MKAVSPWSEQAVATLRQLWPNETAATIGRQLGVTEAAVAAKAGRLQLGSKALASVAKPLRRMLTPLERRIAAARATLPARWAAGVPLPTLCMQLRLSRDVVLAMIADLQLELLPQAVELPAEQPPAELPASSELAPAADAIARSDETEQLELLASVRERSACCWPIGDPGTPDFRFCRAERRSSRVYCDTHQALAFIAVRQPVRPL